MTDPVTDPVTGPVTDPVMTLDDLHRFLVRDFPQVAGSLVVDSLTPNGATVRLRVADMHLRPGGTVSGPSLFLLADAGMYLALLSRIGPVALAVTTSATIDFMRKPAAGRDVLGEVELLKLGRNLAVGQVMMRSDGADALVARASLTYAIPPPKSEVT